MFTDTYTHMIWGIYAHSDFTFFFAYPPVSGGYADNDVLFAICLHIMFAICLHVMFAIFLHIMFAICLQTGPLSIVTLYFC